MLLRVIAARLSPALIFVFILPNGGCTAQLWNWALEHPNNPHHFSAQDQDISQAKDADGHLCLVVSYQVQHSSTRCPMLMIPLDENGRPSPALRYTGNGRSEVEFWASIAASQRRWIDRACIRLNAAVKPGNGYEESDAHIGYALLENDHPAKRGRQGRLVAIAYRLEGRHLAFVNLFHDGEVDAAPTGTQIILIPQDLTDDPAEPGRVAIAISATPVAVAADAVMLPLYACFIISMSVPLTVAAPHGVPMAATNPSPLLRK